MSSLDTIPNGTAARIEALHESVQQLREQFTRFEGQFDTWTRGHDAAHIVLARHQFEDNLKAGERITRVETQLTIRSALGTGWGLLLSAGLAVFGVNKGG